MASRRCGVGVSGDHWPVSLPHDLRLKAVLWGSPTDECYHHSSKVLHSFSSQ